MRAAGLPENAEFQKYILQYRACEAPIIGTDGVDDDYCARRRYYVCFQTIEQHNVCVSQQHQTTIENEHAPSKRLKLQQSLGYW